MRKAFMQNYPAVEYRWFWKNLQIIETVPRYYPCPSKLVENTKAFELTIIKELGKMTP